MGFFDIKLLLIIILAICIYLIYNQINKINLKINNLFNNFKLKNQKINNIMQDNIMQDNIMQDNIMQDNIMQNDFFNITENQNNLNLLNIIENLTGFSDNIMSGCIIKKINIPFNKQPDIINILNVEEIENFEKNYNSLILEEFEKSEIYNDDQIIIEYSEKDDPIIIEDSEKDDPIIIEDSEKNDPVIIEDSEKDDLIILSESEKNNKKHIEIYSNENTPIESTTIEINKLNKSFDDIIKNINKYKLAELQDLAFEYNINIQNNNKKKNKSELIDDIKNYILNKNI